MKQRHFIFGYGSLINSISRSATGETGKAIAVKVFGFERHWSFISQSVAMSSVVVIPQEKAQCTGVIVEVAQDELPQFDIRETGYSRQLLRAEQIQSYQPGVTLPEGNVWLYQTNEVVSPCQNHPIVLSYLDVILAGCLEYSDAFCHDFIANTKGWEGVLINDRAQPRYPRVQPALPIDQLNAFIASGSNLTTESLHVGY